MPKEYLSLGDWKNSRDASQALLVLPLGVLTSALQSGIGGEQGHGHMQSKAGAAGELSVATHTLQGTSSVLCYILQLLGKSTQLISDKTFLSFPQ